MAGNRRQAGGLLYAAGISGCVVQEDGSQKEGGCDLEIAPVLKSVQSAESPGKAVREKLRKKSVKSPEKSEETGLFPVDKNHFNAIMDFRWRRQ